VLHVHRSERADALVEPLAAVLAPPPSDPFTPDVVAVPTRGVERWLAQRLSHHLGAGPGGEAGVCAHVGFASPARIVGDVVARLAGHDAESDPWQGDRLTWTILETVDDALGEPWAAPLARHLGDGEDDEARRGRRLGVARRLARLFSSYAAQRPELVTAWAGGADGRPGVASAVPTDVPPDLVWQAELWRRVRDRIGEPSPAERLADVVRDVVARPGEVDLPERLSVFGPTRLPEDQLRVLHALSAHREVHLWLPHPSPVLWDRVAGLEPASVRRADRPAVARHPVLGSMARDATELQLRLARLAAEAGRPHEHVHHPAPEPPPTLLGALQRRLRADDPDAPPAVVDPQDGSVQVHSCHGLARQVEVLRDVLAGLFADDPTLEPRDVIVMCPDIEVVAPLVAATFGLADADGGSAERPAHPGQALRVRLADRSPRYVNPVLMLLGTLLELADGRVTASEVLDLAASEPVRRRFRFSDDDLARVRQWAVEAGVHWGEGAARRARFGLPAVRQGTWDTALDRILLGAAMAEEDHRFVASALPLDDVDSTDVDLAGRLAELLDRLGSVLADLDGARPRDAWLDALDRAITLLAEAAPTEEWQLTQARRVLSDVRTAGAGHDGVPLRLPDVRVLLADRLQGRPTRAGFRTGALTVCSLEPMRAVPHRVVCLLGLDDGAFPRGGGHDGDDVLRRDPCVGERDRRSEDRQLFLDAVTAASERLVLLYGGADERTGAARPPAVPVGELLDALDAAGRTTTGRSAREHVVVRHPLQTVDERNFAAGVLRRPGPFSFDAHAHAAALAGRGPRQGRVPFLHEPLPPVGADEAGPEVDLDDLVAALEHPVKWFLRRRLQVSLAGEVDEVADRLPLELGPLGQWPLGERLLGALLDGVEPRQALNVEWRRGEVPPKELGRATLLAVQEKVLPVARAAHGYAEREAVGVDVTAELPGGAVVTGTVPGVHGDVVVRSTFSKLGPKHRLRAWVHLLALVVGHPDRTWQAVTVGRAQVSAPRAAVSTLRAPAPTDAARHLGELLALREAAAREPLPLPVACACLYATSREGGAEEVQALEAASQEWSKGFERADDHHVLCWGADATLRELAGTPTPVEQAWWPEDRTRLGVLARRVWQPLLAHEETVTL
jgi:exodeoxyribonuclease V gamma subunit